MLPQDPAQADPSIVALMHGIKTNEGTNGNYNGSGDKGTAAGIGQWSNQVNGVPQPLEKGQIPANFQGQAKQYGLDANDFSPENQNKVMYATLASDKQKGLTPEQILSKWNSGDPNKYLNSATSTGVGSVGAYDVSSYVKNGMSAAQQYAQQRMSQTNTAIPQNQPTPNQVTGDQSQPSLGGFGENVIKSGANFLGNLGNAALHPLQTIQNIGSMGVGGLQELGGQQNDNTQAFDNLKNYFGQRYGSPDNLLHTAYTDPVGLAADISTVLGVGGGAVGLAGKAADLGGLGEAANVAKTGAGALSEASHLTNPLTPIINGASKLISAGSNTAKNLTSQFTEISPQGMQDIYDHPESYTPEQMNTASRLNVAKDVETAIQSKIDSLSETGQGYAPLRETPTPLTTTPDYIDQAFRDAGVEVKDGVVSATSESSVRTGADISKLQSLYNLYKPDFLNGTMDSNKFLNMRTDLADMAYNESGIKSSKLASAGESIRSGLNDNYRKQINGLEEKDLQYSTEKENLMRLKKGFVNKDGELTQSAISKIANAGNKDLDIQRLEELVPGITRRLIALKVMKEIEGAAGIKVGAYAKSITEAGGVVAGVSTGNIPLVAGSIAISLLTSPKLVVPMIRFLGEHKGLVPYVTAALAKYANTGAVSQAIGGTSTQGEQSQQDTLQSPQGVSPSAATSQSSSPASTPLSSGQDITQTPGYQEALKAGYTPQQIQQYLATQLH